jgi:hypothetical protein
MSDTRTEGPGPILVVATLTGALGVWVGMNGMWKGWELKLGDEMLTYVLRKTPGL